MSIDLIEFKARLKTYDDIKLDKSKNRNFKYNKPDLMPSNNKSKSNFENNFFSKNKPKIDYVQNKNQLSEGKSNRRNLTRFSYRGKHIVKHCPDKKKDNICITSLEWGHHSLKCPIKRRQTRSTKCNCKHVLTLTGLLLKQENEIP